MNINKENDISDELLNELCDSISDKIMETGLLTEFIEDGSLATVSLRVAGSKSSWQMYVDLVIDDRESGELSLDEDEDICDAVDIYCIEKELNAEFESLGYLMDNREMITAVLVE